MKRLNLMMLLLAAVPLQMFAKAITVESPDKTLKADINVEQTVSMNVYDGTKKLFGIDKIGIDTDKGILPAAGAKIKKVTTKSVNNTVIPEIKEKTASIPEQYNEAEVIFKDGYSLQFRVYNNGVAYRLVTELPGKIRVNKENAEFTFDKDAKLTFQKDSRSGSDYEAVYVSKNIGELTDEDMGNLPALVEIPDSKRVLFLEADVKDYPCMWIKTVGGNLNIHQWNYPATYRTDGNSYNKKDVITSRDYIAEVEGSRTFPWRIMAIEDNDMDLMANQLVYLMSPECQIEDPSWIKPGWVIFDWWGKNGIYGVDFKAGINTETAKYFIDFAADYGMNYFLFDDGWTLGDDLTKVVPGLDMEEVTSYAAKKGVDVLLWVKFSLIDDQMDEALDQFEKWGIKGLKIDFMNRSDQEISNFYWRAAEECAKHKMVLNFHGAYKPDGLRRAYPNVLTREALIEFEYNGGTYRVTPDHDCTLPFIRNVAGPMDYIPATMNNATRANFRIIGSTPMGQGTRSHAMAMAVVFESPMQMVPDSPTAYYKEEECGRFIANIPTVWDEIVPLAGKVGDYAAVARRNGNEWYVGVITDWTRRKMPLKLDFLEEGKVYDMELFRDGPNAESMAIDYVKEVRKVKKGDVIEADMASGGGWVARIY